MKICNIYIYNNFNNVYKNMRARTCLWTDCGVTVYCVYINARHWRTVRSKAIIDPRIVRILSRINCKLMIKTE